MAPVSGRNQRLIHVDGMRTDGSSAPTHPVDPCHAVLQAARSPHPRPPNPCTHQKFHMRPPTPRGDPACSISEHKNEATNNNLAHLLMLSSTDASLPLMSTPKQPAAGLPGKERASKSPRQSSPHRSPSPTTQNPTQWTAAPLVR